MKTFIVDGYNVIHKIPSLEQQLGNSLEAARKALVELVKRSKPSNTKCIIVFEGKDEYKDMVLPQNNCGIKVVFTKTNQEADRYIVDMLKAESRPRDFTIVSEDNYVCNHARGFGADFMSASTFLKGASYDRCNKKDYKGEEKPGFADMQKITEELKKLWAK